MTAPARMFGAWRFVTTFGAVSLLADIVYEGARSITGPLLVSLGASAVMVGAITGVGEAAALILRLVSGPLADRTGKFWTWTIAGYLLTVLTVPFLGVVGILWAAGALIILERVGKAVRSPAKDTLLSHATAVTGRGRGFGVHKALDQVGALSGPLLVAALFAVFGGDYAPTMALLAIPGLGAIGLLLWLRSRVPEPARYEPAGPQTGADNPAAGKASPAERFPRAFWVYSGFSAITMLGFATFALLSFHQVTRGIVGAGLVPVVYAVAMATAAVAALATGWLYDRLGGRVLVVLPLLAASVPVLAFSAHLGAVLLGAVAWGAAVGVQDSTLKAVVADLVPPPRRATAYGVYAAVIGTALAAGGTLTGFLYDQSVSTLIVVVVAIQVGALAALPWVLRASPRRTLSSAS